jgi:filamentous hemagglutinin
MTTVPYTFGNESSPIPLSQLDANFAVVPNYANTAGTVVNPLQANITALGTLTSLSVSGNAVVGNISTVGDLTALGNLSIGNVTASGNLTGVNNITAAGLITGANFYSFGIVNVNSLISASGNITGANIFATERILAAGNITGANITAVGAVNASANISTTGNVLSQGEMSAVGNITTDGFFIGAFQGSIVGNIVGAPGSNTQVLFNTAGNVDAVGGLTYNKGSNTLTCLGIVSAQGNLISTGNISASGSATIGGNGSIGGNITVGGSAQVSGVVTGPTAPTGTANNQLASTVFVSNQINQYANSVAITGGTITVTSVVANASVTANVIQANVANVGAWTIKEIGTALYFQRANANIAKLDSAGNFTCIGNVTGFGTL